MNDSTVVMPRARAPATYPPGVWSLIYSNDGVCVYGSTILTACKVFGSGWVGNSGWHECVESYRMIFPILFRIAVFVCLWRTC